MACEFGKIISTMLSESRRLDAPVFSIGKLVGNSPYRSLIFTILSARTKDTTTLAACAKLFKKYPAADKLASAKAADVEQLIYGVGFYKQKTKYIIETARTIVVGFGGNVPNEFDELIKLPGVGRKTANVVLAYTFGKNRIAVDTHVHRISNLLGWVKTKTPMQTEKALMRKVPPRLWQQLNHAMVAYGQTICLPRKPRCGICRIRKDCRYCNRKQDCT
jgi:endonuclease-3